MSMDLDKAWHSVHPENVSPVPSKLFDTLNLWLDPDLAQHSAGPENVWPDQVRTVLHFRGYSMLKLNQCFFNFALNLNVSFAYNLCILSLLRMLGLIGPNCLTL